MRRSERRPPIDDSILLAVVLEKAKQIGWDKGVTLTRRDLEAFGRLYADKTVALVHTWHIDGSVSLASVSRVESDRMVEEVVRAGGTEHSYLDDPGSEEGN